MSISNKKLEDYINAAENIIQANVRKEENLFGEIDTKKVREIFDLSSQDPEKSWELYYENIQHFLNGFLPKDNDISKVIRELVCILLTHKEKDNVKYGLRHADSRMSSTKDMENIIDVLVEWSTTPTDYFRLATILLQKGKNLKYIPENRIIADYI